MIQLQNIEKTYRTDTVETLALNDINLEVAKGEFLTIMGPSGCGKSTLLNIIGLLDNPTKGSVEIDGQKQNKCLISDWQISGTKSSVLFSRVFI